MSLQEDTGPAASGPPDAAAAALIITANVVQNTQQTVIQITEDRLRLNLREHLLCTEFRRSWLIPLSVLVTVVLTMVTADFKKSLGVSAATWQAIFMIVAAGCAVWLVVIVFRILTDRRKPTDDAFIGKCKAGPKFN